MNTRIQSIEPGTRPELALLEKQILAERGRISPLYQILLNAPEIAKGWEALLTAIRNRNSLPASIRELIILRVAVLNKAPYEFDAHVPHALKAGMDDIKVQEFKNLNVSTVFSEREQLILKLTDVMTIDIQVPDALFDKIRPHFSDQEILELVATISAYNMVSRLLNALHIGH